MSTTKRGKFEFEIGLNGNLLPDSSNLEKLRRVFLDRSFIKDALLGPGNYGDFDNGAWHVLCHLAGGCAVFKKNDKYLWVEISHVPAKDIYAAKVWGNSNGSLFGYEISSAEGAATLQGAAFLGFVEGSSLGHISARNVSDNNEIFNKWKRQDFDQDVDSDDDGGRVWEHWCTVRDLRPSSIIGISVLKAYLEMLSVCGGKLASIVARGRRQYHHPEQLLALYTFGVVSKEDALFDLDPKPIPLDAQKLIYSAEPGKCLEAVMKLPWESGKLNYFMFKRRIDKWSKSNDVKSDFAKYNLN